MSSFLTICEKAARAGGAVLTDKLGTVNVREKGRADLVTEADIQAQAVIQKMLAEAYPEHGFIGEESGLSTNRPEGYYWVADPLDGTTNFVHNVPHFATSLALVHDGKPLVACVYNPLTQECFTAQQGAGAFLNEQPIRVSEVKTPDQALAVVGFPPTVDSDTPELKLFLQAIEICQAIRRTGSAALNLCYVACGRFDTMWNFGAKIWDIAAGLLILQEAGGTVTAYDGAELDLFRPKMIASSCQELNDSMVRLCKESGVRF